MGPVIFLSGYNQRAVFTLLRVCVKHSIEAQVIANGFDDPIFLTAYSSNVVAVRTPGSMDDFLVHLQHISASSIQKPVTIMPTTEYLNRWLLDNREQLSEYNIAIPLPDKSVYNLISDKSLFYDYCQKSSLPVPYCYNQSNPVFPCIAKAPTYDKYMGKPVYLRNAEEYRLLLEKHPDIDWLLQQYIDGYSYYLLYYFAQDGSVISYSQCNIAQQCGGRSILAARSAELHDSSISSAYEEIFRATDYKGPVMVEVRESEGHYVMIEANPRPWGPCQLVVDACVPIFERYFADMGYDLSLQPEPVRPTYYFWENGFNGSFNNADYFSSDYTVIENNLSIWRSVDILNRQDTKKLYVKGIYRNK